jgi:hypothetical protein|tara:strand:- start:43 stop:300 length:258 start_codon:yes stop_codon:yes gene_type:complete
MGAIFNPKPKRDPNAERMQKQLEAERQSRLDLEAKNAADEADRRTKRFGYAGLMGENATYAGFTGSADKDPKRQKTRNLGGGGAV